MPGAALSVAVSVNGLEGLAGCPGAGCHFTYALSASPSVTSILPSTLSASVGFEMTIVGRNFDVEDMTRNQVTVAGEECVVVGAEQQGDATELRCTAPALPAGTYTPTVAVAGRGSSVNSVAVTYALHVDSVDPVQGSAYGLTRVTLAGGGFLNSTSSSSSSSTGPQGNLTVGIGRSASAELYPCAVVRVTAVELVCDTSMVEAGHWDQAMVVVVQLETEAGGEVEASSSTRYVFRASLAPTLAAVAPASVAAYTPTALAIQWQPPNAWSESLEDVRVVLGSVECAITSVRAPGGGMPSVGRS